ncbi:unnamed protein product, partial [Agarophyton chilense]
TAGAAGATGAASPPADAECATTAAVVAAAAAGAQECAAALLQQNQQQCATRGARAASSLPRALDAVDKLVAQLARQRRRVVFFLDYDGTLSPIVEDPERAVLPEETRHALRMISSRFTTAIVSGRSKDKVRALVDVRGLIYAGSHGFDIEAPHGDVSHRVAAEFVPKLRAARGELTRAARSLQGATVEDNLLAVSFHYRRCAAQCAGEVRELAERVARQHGLRLTHGKKVYELRPQIDWHKGKAVEYLLRVLQLEGAHVLPIYIGDDTTDEDAFSVLRARGLSIVVDDGAAPRSTMADLRLHDPDEVCRFLLRFADDALAEAQLQHVAPTRRDRSPHSLPLPHPLLHHRHSPQ